MSLVTGILMSGSNKVFNLEMEVNSDDTEVWRTAFTNGVYSRILDVPGTDTGNDTMPVKGGYSVTASVSKISDNSTTAGNIEWYVNGFLVFSDEFEGSVAVINRIFVFTGLSADDVLKVTINE